MATVSKNFRIKDGLIVEGTTGTINGENILTTASTTTDLAEGTRLYYTNERVDDRVANLVQGGTGITVTYDDNGNALGLSADFGEFSTTDIAEGDKLFFTDERAQDAIAAALAAGNHVNITVEYNDAGNAINLTGAITYTDADARNAISGGDSIGYNPTTGVISAEATTLGGISVTEAGLEVNRTVVDTWYDASGSADGVQGNLEAHASNATTHGVTGDIVGTSDVQTLSGKTFSDSVGFGAFGSSIVADFGAEGDLDVSASNNLHLTAQSGNIILQADGAAYVNSASAGNQIATNAYVDNAVSGLAWKEAVHLFSRDSNIDLTGTTGTLIIDDHAALTDTHGPGYRILVAGQTDATENGLYIYADNGTSYTLTRTEDADLVSELLGAAIFVMEGDVYGTTSWVQSNHYANSFDDLVWTQFSGGGSVTAGTGITVNGLQVSVDRSAVDGWYDASGSAAQAVLDANAYADLNFVNIDDLPGQLDDYIPLIQKGAGDGVATLDGNTQVPASQLGNQYVTSVGTNLDVTAQELTISDAPTFTEVDINSLTKQVAYTASVSPSGGTVKIELFKTGQYKSAEVIVKITQNDMSGEQQISKMLLAYTDGSVYVTEYGTIETRLQSLGTVSAEFEGPGAGHPDPAVNLVLTAPTSAISTYITVYATLIK